MQRIRRQGRGVVLVEFHQRLGQVTGGRVAGRIGVSLELVFPGIHRHHRAKTEGEDRNNHEEHHQGDRIGYRGRNAQPLEEPGGIAQLAKRPEEGEAQAEGPGHAPKHVVEAIVAEFVRQHGLDLRRIQAIEECVEEDDALGLAEACEVGVAMAGAPRAVHHEQALRLEAALGQKGLDAAPQIAVFHGRELVEQRRDEGWVHREHQHVETAPDQPYPEPPQRSHAAHKPEHGQHQGKSHRRRDQRLLGQITDEHGRGHLVETEARFKAEHAVGIERQVDQGTDDADHGDERHTGYQAVAESSTGGSIDEGKTSAERQGQQQQGVDHEPETVQPCLGRRIVGRLLMGDEVDLRGERFRHAIAVGLHVTDVTPGKPEAQTGGEKENDHEGEAEGIHDGIRMACVRRI